MSEERAERVWRGLRSLVLERHERRREVCDALGMSFIRVKALRSLAASPKTMRELAADLLIDAPYATLVVDDLVRRGLARREVHPEDRRSRIVRVTPEGTEAAARADSILSAPPPPLLSLPRRTWTPWTASWPGC
ncbi:MarR family winged helix-turn-helix transcriptional regulator [Thermocatellispora tengchongensis]|uniref:MarR family winged helix-turn-helix transcriptional regulator n=1 Tax=Thermocatellispora tengchongensis TaxID=1073253 RepID=UPI00363161B0